MSKILKQLKPFIERYPILAATYRAGRDAWVMNHQKPQLTPFGFKFMGHRDMQLGNFEPEETTLIKSFLTKTDVFVDVGANIGFYTCLARSANKYVIAIEPLFQNLSYLVINLIENNWNDVEIYPVGVSDRIGIASLYGSGTGASLIAGWAESSLHHRSAIAVSTLDILSHGYKNIIISTKLTIF